MTMEPSVPKRRHIKFRRLVDHPKERMQHDVVLECHKDSYVFRPLTVAIFRQHLHLQFIDSDCEIYSPLY